MINMDNSEIRRGSIISALRYLAYPADRISLIVYNEIKCKLQK